MWLGSWGSRAGLRRVARAGDGWLASAYNTTPERFAAARVALAHLLEERGRDALLGDECRQLERVAEVATRPRTG